MKTILTVVALTIAAQSLGGCALLGGIAIGGIVVHEHEKWCYQHRYDPGYWRDCR